MEIALMSDQNGHECIRCGHCCMAVGRAFWAHGDFFRWPELQERAEQTIDEGDGLPCEMLIVENGIATCKIERDYGRAAKPAICRDYPPDYPEESCQQQEKRWRGQGICYQECG